MEMSVHVFYSLDFLCAHACSCWVSGFLLFVASRCIIQGLGTFVMHFTVAVVTLKCWVEIPRELMQPLRIICGTLVWLPAFLHAGFKFFPAGQRKVLGSCVVRNCPSFVLDVRSAGSMLCNVHTTHHTPHTHP